VTCTLHVRRKEIGNSGLVLWKGYLLQELFVSLGHKWEREGGREVETSCDHSYACDHGEGCFHCKDEGGHCGGEK